MEDSLTNDDTLLSAAEARLAALERERAELLESINRLRVEQEARLEPSKVTAAPIASSSVVPARVFPPALVSRDSSATDKVALFASLFRGRTDVYAHRWENRRLRPLRLSTCLRK